MNGLNQQFLKDPAGFLSRFVVDNYTCQQGTQGAQILTILNTAKSAMFDFEEIDAQSVRFRPLVSLGKPPAVKGDTPIRAYWCPFIAGGGLPGWVDVPRKNPAQPVVFTAAMQGCAFVLTDCPDDASSVRVYHNQHPGSGTDSKIKSASGDAIAGLSFSEYSALSEKEASAGTNSFNLMFHTSGAWKFVSQCNLFVPQASSFGVARSSLPTFTKSCGV